MTAEQVTAVIVTRGDVDLTPILETLPYPDVQIWDNSEHTDARTFGRYIAAQTAGNDVVYFQDDDLLFTEHERLLEEWEPGRIVANMPSPWFEECEYDRTQCILVGAGSLVPKHLPWTAFQHYLSEWPSDELFLDYCDFVSGILSPAKRVDLGYELLPQASNPGRISTTPGSDSRKWTVMNRALALREEILV